MHFWKNWFLCSFVVGIISAFSFAAESEKRNDRDLAISIQPVQILEPNIALEIDYKLSEKISLAIPFGVGFEGAYSGNTNVSINVGAGPKFFVTGHALNGFYVAPLTEVTFTVRPGPTFTVSESGVFGLSWTHSSGFFLDVNAGVSYFATFGGGFPRQPVSGFAPATNFLVGIAI